MHHINMFSGHLSHWIFVIVQISKCLGKSFYPNGYGVDAKDLAEKMQQLSTEVRKLTIFGYYIFPFNFNTSTSITRELKRSQMLGPQVLFHPQTSLARPQRKIPTFRFLYLVVSSFHWLCGRLHIDWTCCHCLPRLRVCNCSLSPLDQDTDGLISQALLVGNFEGAVDLCLNDGRYPEAILLSISGGEELLKKTQQKYLLKQKNSISMVSESLPSYQFFW